MLECAARTRACLSRAARRAFPAAAAFALLAGCSGTWLAPLERDHPLAGLIWDARSEREVSREVLLQLAVASRFVFLGETHDNPDHHRLQAEVLAAMLGAGRAPALAMEQFDREHQGALDTVRARGERNPERISDAGAFDRKGWDWAAYRPLVELASGNGLRLVAANFSRSEARALIGRAQPAEGLAPAPAALRAAIERDIVEGHCGMPLPAALAAGMVEAQRARDSQIAVSVENSGEAGAVLIAGAGHVRRDRAAPIYLAPTAREALLVIAFVEVEQNRTDPRDYAAAGSYDLVWFTPRAERVDPCESLRGKG